MLTRPVLILSWAALTTSRSVSGSSGLQVEVTKPVSCQESEKAVDGDKVTVHYGGFLQDGKYQQLEAIIQNLIHYHN